MNQDQCCQCLRVFTADREPMMMSTCIHNICSVCLEFVMKSFDRQIRCRFCSSIYRLDKSVDYNFPKNIRLNQHVKTHRPSSSHHNSSDTMQQLSNSLLLSTDSLQSVGTCPQHSKPLDIICLTDKIRICSHCAIFGEHKDHKFHTAGQFEKDVAKKQLNINFLLERKDDIDKKLAEEFYSQEIQNKILQKKQQIINEIRDKFQVLYTSIKRAESEVYKQVMDLFDEALTQSDINQDSFNSLNKNLQDWKKQCKNSFKEIKKAYKLDDKLKIFYQQCVNLEKEGTQKIQKLEKKIQQKIYKGEKLLHSIKVEFNPINEKTLKNFINITFKNIEMEKTKNRNKSEDRNKDSNPVMTVSMIQLNPQKKSNMTTTFLSQLTKNPTISKCKSTTKPNFSRVKSPTRKMKQKVKDPSLILQNFLEKSEGEALDFSDCGIDDDKLIQLLYQASESKKKLKGLKLTKNNLTNNGIIKIFPYLSNVTNLNLSENNLTEDILQHFIEKKEKISNLRVMNLWNNKMNERLAKSYIEELKRRGIIVTL